MALKRLTRFERLERLERLERDPFLVSIRDYIVRERKKGNKEKFSLERLCLLTCLLMGGPPERVDA